MSYIDVLKTGNDHTVWLKGLEFYRDEIGIQQKRLQEIAGKKHSPELLAGVEHFQNQFLIQQKNISDLKHKVRNYVKAIANDVREHDGKVDESFLKKGMSLKEEYEWTERIMNGLRREFNSFLDKWK